MVGATSSEGLLVKMCRSKVKSRQVQIDEIGYSFALVQMVFLCHHLAKEVLVSYVIDR